MICRTSHHVIWQMLHQTFKAEVVGHPNMCYLITRPYTSSQHRAP